MQGLRWRGTDVLGFFGFPDLRDDDGNAMQKTYGGGGGGGGGDGGGGLGGGDMIREVAKHKKRIRWTATWTPLFCLSR